VFVGLSILQPNPMGMGSPMITASSTLAGYSLIALGAIVFFTGAFVFLTRIMEHRSTLGLLMIVYGIVMLVLGVGMLGQLFNIMMQGSVVSGIARILVGLVMLYSGSQMTSTKREDDVTRLTLNGARRYERPRNDAHRRARSRCVHHQLPYIKWRFKFGCPHH